jgi:hypothetical protein
MLSFSKRTQASVTVFACMFIAQTAQTLTSSTAQANSLQLSYANLISIYRQLVHQDVANQASVLDAIIVQALTAVQTLNATVQAITPTISTAFELTGIQAITANAVAVMLTVNAASDDGE